jgi:hypothetical protein
LNLKINSGEISHFMIIRFLFLVFFHPPSAFSVIFTPSYGSLDLRLILLLLLLKEKEGKTHINRMLLTVELDFFYPACLPLGLIDFDIFN